VVAPLKHIGPYVCLSLRFPKLDNSMFDFSLDTGANVNSLDDRLAKKLNLPLVQKVDDLALVGSTGEGPHQKAGNLCSLGDCILAGLPPPSISFMKNLSAAALSYASPVGVGLLSLSFFHCFPAGIELDWFGTDGDPPTIVFYYGKTIPSDVGTDMRCVPLQPLVGGVLSLNIAVNGVEIPALLDTGSPISVLN
jgi:hypothetical protein